jgi:hypothetical protein
VRRLGYVVARTSECYFRPKADGLLPEQVVVLRQACPLSDEPGRSLRNLWGERGQSGQPDGDDMSSERIQETAAVAQAADHANVVEQQGIRRG